MGTATGPKSVDTVTGPKPVDTATGPKPVDTAPGPKPATELTEAVIKDTEMRQATAERDQTLIHRVGLGKMYLMVVAGNQHMEVTVLKAMVVMQLANLVLDLVGLHLMEALPVADQLLQVVEILVLRVTVVHPAALLVRRRGMVQMPAPRLVLRLRLEVRLVPALHPVLPLRPVPPLRLVPPLHLVPPLRLAVRRVLALRLVLGPRAVAPKQVQAGPLGRRVLAAKQGLVTTLEVVSKVLGRGCLL